MVGVMITLPTYDIIVLDMISYGYFYDIIHQYYTYDIIDYLLYHMPNFDMIGKPMINL